MNEGSPWILKRQDDNGQEFEMARFLSHEAAEQQRKAYEAKGHKQMYWIEHCGQVVRAL